MPHPSTSSAYGIWSLNEVRDAVRGENWVSPAPRAPDTVTAVEGVEQATITFSGQVTFGDSPTFTVTSSPDGITATGSSSPITVTGLTNGTEYTFTVTVEDDGGTDTSSPSNSVTPTSSANLWSVTSGFENVYSIFIGGVGQTVNQSSLEQLMGTSEFQDINNIETRNEDAMGALLNSGESITFDYNVPGTTSISFRLQRQSSVNVDFTISGAVSISGSVSSSSSVFTDNSAPSQGSFTITANNDSNGLFIQAIDFNGASAGDLTYG